MRLIIFGFLLWLAYGIVRVGMGLLGYGGNEWFRGVRRKPRVWLPVRRGDD